MSRYIGNYLRVPSSEPQQSSAPGVWSLSDQLAYQRANLWPPARDPYYNQTVLHLSGDVAGTRETNPVTQPRTFLSDASSNNFLLTPNGDVSARPFSPYGGNNYSVYFPGGTARVQFPSGNIIPASGTYTIECWIYPTSLNATYGGVIASQGTTPSGDNGRTGLSITAAGILTFGIGESFPSFNSGSNVIKLNQWTHVAITRNNTVFTMYINGNRINQVTSSKTTDSGFLRLGTLWDGDGNGLVPYVGYISNFRIVYSVLTDFTNRTDSLTAISNTALLTCQSNRFIDNSSNNYLATIVGSPQVSDNSPFVSYDTTSGSGYFDGTGDYLSGAAGVESAFNLTADFTVEAWVYFTALASYNSWIAFADGSGNNGWQFMTETNKLQFQMFTTGVYYNTTSTNSLITNTWYHVAATRSGSNITLYINGVANGTSTYAGNPTSASSYLRIGADRTTSTYFNGYLSNLRVIKGTAVYTGNFTPPTASLRLSGASSAASYPNTANVNISFAESATSLLTLQTRAPANNQGILDTSPNNFVVTRTGNVAQGSFSPFSSTGWSNYFSGSNAYLRVANNSAFYLGSGDFTMECWVNPANVSATRVMFNKYISGSINTSNTAFILYLYNASGTPRIGANLCSGTTETFIGWNFPGGVNVLNTWNHIALVRQGNTISVYCNGVACSIATGTSSYSSTLNDAASADLSIALRYNDNDGPLTGYISNARIVKGQALYTGSFTSPSSALTATSVGTSGTNVATSITGTVSLLTCQSNRFVDNSPNNFTVQTFNTPTVQAFSPFAPAQSYTPSQIGGSAYFDASGDSIAITSSIVNPSGTEDFTLEFWFYHTMSSWPGGFLYYITGTGSGTFGIYYNNVQNEIVVQQSGVTQIINTAVSNTPLNQWNHYALVRSSNSWAVWINGTRTSGPITNSTSFNAATGFSISPTNAYVSGFRIVKQPLYLTSQSTIPVPTAPPQAVNNTTTLLNFTGAGIVDATGKNVMETVGNSAVQTTQSRWPPGSMYFDGTGDYLVAPSSQFWTFGSTEDFTIEFWFYTSVTVPVSGSTPSALISNYPDWNTWTNRWAIATNDNKIKWYDHTGNPAIASNNFTYSVWNHVAVVRSSSSIKMYINGTQEGSTQTTNQTYTSTEKLYVGFVPSGVAFNGYIDDLRITKGYARYVVGTGGNAGQMVFNGTTTLAFPTINTRPFPLA